MNIIEPKTKKILNKLKEICINILKELKHILKSLCIKTVEICQKYLKANRCFTSTWSTGIIIQFVSSCYSYCCMCTLLNSIILWICQVGWILSIFFCLTNHVKDFQKHSTALKSRTNSVQRALLYVQNVATDLERDLFIIIKKNWTREACVENKKVQIIKGWLFNKDLIFLQSHHIHNSFIHKPSTVIMAD